MREDADEGGMKKAGKDGRREWILDTVACVAAVYPASPSVKRLSSLNLWNQYLFIFFGSRSSDRVTP